MKMTEQIQIQPYRETYKKAVVDLIVPIQQREFGLPITAQDQPDLDRIPGYYQKGCGNFWVAVNKQQVVGTIALLDIGNHQAALRKMFVRPDWRGQEKGTAVKLLDSLLAWGRDVHVKDIYLGTTEKFLAAHKFYEKKGFLEITKNCLPKSFPVMAVDTKFYRYQGFDRLPGNPSTT